MDVPLGQHVTTGEKLGELFNSFGKRLAIVKAARSGLDEDARDTDVP